MVGAVVVATSIVVTMWCSCVSFTALFALLCDTVVIRQYGRFIVPYYNSSGRIGKCTKSRLPSCRVALCGGSNRSLSRNMVLRNVGPPRRVRPVFYMVVAVGLSELGRFTLACRMLGSYLSTITLGKCVWALVVSVGARVCMVVPSMSQFRSLVSGLFLVKSSMPMTCLCLCVVTFGSMVSVVPIQLPRPTVSLLIMVLVLIVRKLRW